MNRKLILRPEAEADSQKPLIGMRHAARVLALILCELSMLP